VNCADQVRGGRGHSRAASACIEPIHVLPQGTLRVHQDACDFDARLLLLESERPCARADAGARRNDRARNLRRSALSRAAVLVQQRRGRPLMAPGVTGAVASDAQPLTPAVADIFTATGIAAADAQIVAADLVAADLEGIASHGVMLVPMYVERISKGSVSRRSVGEVVSDRASAIIIDAGNVLGQLTSRQAVMLAVARARETGLAAVVVRNGFHFGTAGRYAPMMPEQNFASTPPPNPP